MRHGSPVSQRTRWLLTRAIFTLVVCAALVTALPAARQVPETA
jgi:hypothetical protein